MPNADQPRIIRFDFFEVDLRAGELRKSGVKVKLQEQPFRILVTLLQHPGDVVTREELHRELWPADTFVDFEHGLNAAVKRLRDALGESAEKPIYVETLARRGYRFMAPIEKPATPSLVHRLMLFARARWAFRWRYMLGTGIAVAILALLATLIGPGASTGFGRTEKKSNLWRSCRWRICLAIRNKNIFRTA